MLYGGITNAAERGTNAAERGTNAAERGKNAAERALQKHLKTSKKDAYIILSERMPLLHRVH